MLNEKSYVRCKWDSEYPNDPREFFYGKIRSINHVENTALVDFFDTNGVSTFYSIPKTCVYSLNELAHSRIRQGAVVEASKERYILKSYFLNKDDGYYYYYLLSYNNEIVCLPESEIIASCNDGVANPIAQIRRYEFQNPVFFFGHANVSRKEQIINNSLYGFKDLAGCKIFLKPYQMKTVMRCLQNENCRYMIADEVGLGKTIEAVSVLKIYLNSHRNQEVIIVVPEALIEQWRTELAFKFKLFEGGNVNNNHISICSSGDMQDLLNNRPDFLIVDEVHQLMKDEKQYRRLLYLSKSSKNVILLSATPIQKREEEYRRLLTLIQPEKYEGMDNAAFNAVLQTQNLIIRKIHAVLESLDTLLEELKDNGYKHNDDAEELFEELMDSFSDVQKQVKNSQFNSMIDDISYDEEDFSIVKIQTAIAYICENYQLEKSIIRNRRDLIADDCNSRELVTLNYDMQTTFNDDEYNAYRTLLNWIEDNDLLKTEKHQMYVNLIKSFSSSAAAYIEVLLKCKKVIQIPEEVFSSAQRWNRHETKLVDEIGEVLDEDISQCNSRITAVINYLDQELHGEKALIFTNYSRTFEVYKSALENYFGDDCCCYFNKNMSREELEVNAYKFQNDPNCFVMLSDESGGEGRNFQIAGSVIHADLPWSANDIEQRIGRLDRIGREEGKPVVSVVPYAMDTIESDLFEIWSQGLGIFTKSQTGLEIIMGDLDHQIMNAFISDAKYGLSNVLPNIVKMIEDLSVTVKQERYFDLAAYQYSSINKLLDKSIDLFNREETALFSESMMSWASLTGFKAIGIKNGVMFTSNSISINSLAKTLFIPPDMKKLIDDKMNQMRNRVRILSGIKERTFEDRSISGTFDRKYAVSNDYIHFYAPGDEIFDSIVNNALYSYKGTSAAFAVESKINWKGFVFLWKLEIDGDLIYASGLNPNYVNQFRGYLPMNEFISAISIGDSDIDENTVINEFRRILKLDAKKYAIHYGKRSSKNLSLFKSMYPRDKWNSLVDECYKAARVSIGKKAKPLIDASIANLKVELTAQEGAQAAAAIFYGKEENNKVETEKILTVLSKPKMILDAVCYVDMVNR